MRFLKMLGLMAVAAIQLIAFTALASASPLTSPAGTSYTSTLKAEGEGTLTLEGAFETIKCQKSTAEGAVEAHSATTAGGKVSSLTFSECNYSVTVNKAGSLEIHAIGGGKGTVTSSGAEISIATSVGTCVFTTLGTHIGTLTDSNITGGAATLDIAGAKIPRTGGNFLCGSSGTWAGSYKVKTPNVLYVGHPPIPTSPLTSPSGTAYTGTIKAASEGVTKLDGSFVTVECKSTAEGAIASHTSTSAKGELASLTFSECNYLVSVLRPGFLTVHAPSGTVTSSGAEISIATSVGTCVFTTNGTDVGTLEDSSLSGGPATLNINSSKIPRTAGSFICGSSGTWTGSYEVTSPSVLYLGHGPLTSPKGTSYASTLKAESEGAISLDGKFGTVSCQKSDFEGSVESHTSSSVSGKLSGWTFGECTDPVTVETTGTFKIQDIGGGEGTVTSSGAKISISTSVGTCVFTASSTDLGTLADSDVTEGKATLDSSFAAIPRTGGSSSCGPNAVLTGSYDVTTPSTLYID